MNDSATVVCDEFKRQNSSDLSPVCHLEIHGRVEGREMAISSCLRDEKIHMSHQKEGKKGERERERKGGREGGWQEERGEGGRERGKGTEHPSWGKVLAPGPERPARLDTMLPSCSCDLSGIVYVTCQPTVGFQDWTSCKYTFRTTC